MTRATAIVRTRDEVAGVERALRSLHAQTVRPEIVVVASGSTDGTLDVAGPLCDRLIEIAPEEFSYGGALNIGTRAASAPVAFALSAHCVADRSDWIERSLAHYERADVAATNGLRWLPGGAAPSGVLWQDAAHAHAHPWWGFPNHASSWRVSVWERFPFSETLPYAEDREWARRVLDAGHTIAFDPALWIDWSHVWRNGVREVFERNRRHAEALRRFADLPPYGLRDLARDWWADMPDGSRPPAFHRFVNYLRMASLAGRYVGRRRPRL